MNRAVMMIAVGAILVINLAMAPAKRWPTLHEDQLRRTGASIYAKQCPPELCGKAASYYDECNEEFLGAECRNCMEGSGVEDFYQPLDQPGVCNGGGSTTGYTFSTTDDCVGTRAVGKCAKSVTEPFTYFCNNLKNATNPPDPCWGADTIPIKPKVPVAQ